MFAIRIEITRWVDSDQPGWVECRLVDASDREWLFTEKVPVVTAAPVASTSSFPQPGVIACQILEKRSAPDGREIITVDTGLPWGVAARSGETQFEIFAAQILEI